MSRKEEYKQKNEAFMEQLRLDAEIKQIPGGVCYKVLKSAEKASSKPQLQSVVSVHYTGRLINGREFDNSRKRGYPEAFRLNQVIEGWQMALQQMQVGDRWEIYIPYELGYGTRTSGPIPGFSTLIFDVELLSIA